MSRLAFILVTVTAGAAAAQSAPPDLQPKFIGEPTTGRTVEQKEKPRLQEPPRQPVAPESVMNTAPSAPASGR